jgi:hypothetical protein
MLQVLVPVGFLLQSLTHTIQARCTHTRHYRFKSPATGTPKQGNRHNCTRTRSNSSTNTYSQYNNNQPFDLCTHKTKGFISGMAGGHSHCKGGCGIMPTRGMIVCKWGRQPLILLLLLPLVIYLQKALRAQILDRTRRADLATVRQKLINFLPNSLIFIAFSFYFLDKSF